MREFNEIWIINEAGLVLYHTVNNATAESVELFGGFLTAINQFTEFTSKQSITSLNLGNKFLIFYRDLETKIIVIGLTESIQKEKHLRNILKTLYKMFEKKFGKKMLKGFNGGNIQQFEVFSKDIDNFFSDKTHVVDGIW
ncbi:MAG: hypothetical protein K9W44_13930 [Candidatus Lokiarchaeota archaeon]|nr:hypothetical protein [Candidatus Harpocratesius repetitus]